MANQPITSVATTVTICTPAVFKCCGLRKVHSIPERLSAADNTYLYHCQPAGDSGTPQYLPHLLADLQPKKIKPHHIQSHTTQSLISNTNKTQDDAYEAVIATTSSQEFARFTL